MYDNYNIVKRCLSGDYALVKSAESKMLLDNSNIIDLNPFDKSMQAFVECYQNKVKHHFNIGNGKILWLAPSVIDNAILIDLEHEFLKNHFHYYAKTDNHGRYGFWYDNKKEKIMFGLLNNKRYSRDFEQNVLSMIADFCQSHDDLSVLGTLDDNSKITHQFVCGTEEQIEKIKQKLMEE